MKLNELIKKLREAMFLLVDEARKSYNLTYSRLKHWKSKPALDSQQRGPVINFCVRGTPHLGWIGERAEEEEGRRTRISRCVSAAYSISQRKEAGGNR